MLILAIESSCDDSSASVVNNNAILCNVVRSQIEHSRYGGVIPELASREHLAQILPLCQQAMEESGLQLSQLDAIAATQGPGLMGSLLVGWCFAKSLALALGKPLIGVDHMLGHILSPAIGTAPEYPMLNLIVSGGHTLIVLLKAPTQFTVIGRTQDDAAGEAFDKGAKMLGLNYPGGPEIDRLAKTGNPSRFEFPKPSIGGFDFSFSGLKTALLYLHRDLMKSSQPIDSLIPDLAASYQNAIVGYLLRQWAASIKQLKPKSIGLGGGVAMNSGLRAGAEKLAADLGLTLYCPPAQYCTDNAAMIGHAAWHLYNAGHRTLQTEVPYARMKT